MDYNKKIIFSYHILKYLHRPQRSQRFKKVLQDEVLDTNSILIMADVGPKQISYEGKKLK